jgi:hypothetical protein
VKQFSDLRESLVESVELDEAMGKLNAKGEIEMTAKNYAKVHKDYKTKMKGVPYAMQIDPKTGGSALYPVKIIKESVEEGKKPVSQMTPAEKKADAERRKEYNAHQKSKRESVDLEEGKMKEFHDYIDQGKSAQWIAKKMGLDMKTVKELMADMKESVEEGKTGAERLTNRLKKSGVDLDKRAKDRAASHAELKKKYAKESVELDEAYQQFLDKTPNWGEDKAISYGRKKGYKEIGVCGHGKIDGIVLFGMDAGDKAYVGKEAKVKTGQTVFRYATKRTVAGDIFPLVKIDVKRGILYNLSQKSSEGEIEHAEFETKGVKLRYLRLLASANLRDITGFDPGFGSMKESTAPKTLSDIREARA